MVPYAGQMRPRVVTDGGGIGYYLVKHTGVRLVEHIGHAATYAKLKADIRADRLLEDRPGLVCGITAVEPGLEGPGVEGRHQILVRQRQDNAIRRQTRDRREVQTPFRARTHAVQWAADHAVRVPVTEDGVINAFDLLVIRKTVVIRVLEGRVRPALLLLLIRESVTVNVSKVVVLAVVVGVHQQRMCAGQVFVVVGQTVTVEITGAVSGRDAVEVLNFPRVRDTVPIDIDVTIRKRDIPRDGILPNDSIAEAHAGMDPVLTPVAGKVNPHVLHGLPVVVEHEVSHQALIGPVGLSVSARRNSVDAAGPIPNTDFIQVADQAFAEARVNRSEAMRLDPRLNDGISNPHTIDQQGELVRKLVVNGGDMAPAIQRNLESIRALLGDNHVCQSIGLRHLDIGDVEVVLGRQTQFVIHLIGPDRTFHQRTVIGGLRINPCLEREAR